MKTNGKDKNKHEQNKHPNNNRSTTVHSDVLLVNSNNNRLEHKHNYQPAIIFDWLGCAYDYGRCRCGKTIM
jgi:hypothetical protein